MAVHVVDGHYLGYSGVAGIFWLREGNELAIVDANTSRAIPYLEAALNAAGKALANVRYIFITHVHLDHSGGAAELLRHCPEATVLAHPRALPHLVDPSRLVKSAMATYGEARFRKLYGEVEAIPEDRIQITEDGQEIEWGHRRWKILHTRGHANHHHCLVDSKESVVFTGDSFGIGYRDLQKAGPWIFPSTSPTNFDPDAAIESVRRIAAMNTERVGLTHFGLHGEVKARAQELESQLLEIRDFLEETDELCAEEELDQRCREWVGGFFERAIASRNLRDHELIRARLSIDIDLNAQGIAFEIRRRRRKRA